MPLVLSSEDIVASITMADAIEAIDGACRQEADGKAVVAGRLNLQLPNGWMRLMPAALLTSNVLGYKEFHLTRMSGTEAHVRYAYHLIEYSTGRLLAMLDANHVTSIRTGATAGVALRYLAPQGSVTAGIIGSGAEARAQIEALAAVRTVTRAKIYSRTASKRERFATDVGRELGIPMEPIDRPEAAAQDVDVLLVATNTNGTGPALLGEWIPKGLHINSIGSTLPTQREIDPAVWSVADRIVLDTRKLLEESGDAIAAKAAGTIDDAKLVELRDLVAGKALGRERPDQTTLYKSVGTGLQDVAVAYRIYENAKAAGRGREFGDYQSVKVVEPN